MFVCDFYNLLTLYSEIQVGTWQIDPIPGRAAPCLQTMMSNEENEPNLTTTRYYGKVSTPRRSIYDRHVGATG